MRKPVGKLTGFTMSDVPDMFLLWHISVISSGKRSPILRSGTRTSTRNASCASTLRSSLAIPSWPSSRSVDGRPACQGFTVSSSVPDAEHLWARSVLLDMRQQPSLQAVKRARQHEVSGLVGSYAKRAASWVACWQYVLPTGRKRTISGAI